jgi:hypothetical protein
MSSTLIHSPSLSLGIGNQRENGQSGKEGEGIRSQREEKKKKKRKEAVWTRSSRAPDWIDMTLCVGSKKKNSTTTPGDGQEQAGSSSLGVVAVVEIVYVGKFGSIQ